MYRIKYKEKTFNFKGKLVTITDDRLFSEDDEFYKKFKSHFKKADNVQMLVEEPIEDAKVEVETESVAEVEDHVPPNEVEVNDEVVETVEIDFEALETKDELVQYIKDKGIEVNLGRTKDVEKIKEKIREVVGE